MTPRSGSVPVAGKPADAGSPAATGSPVIAVTLCWRVSRALSRMVACCCLFLRHRPPNAKERTRGSRSCRASDSASPTARRLRATAISPGRLPSAGTNFSAALDRDDIGALVGVRGGYGSNYLLDDLQIAAPANPKIVLGFSDLTSLQIYLWQRHRWITFYGPMLAAGFEAGEGAVRRATTASRCSRRCRILPVAGS